MCKFWLDARIFWLFCKSCWDTSVSCSLPSATDYILLSSLDGAMLFHKCSGGTSSTSMSSMSFYVFALVGMNNVCHMVIVLVIGFVTT